MDALTLERFLASGSQRRGHFRTPFGTEASYHIDWSGGGLVQLVHTDTQEGRDIAIPLAYAPGNTSDPDYLPGLRVAQEATLRLLDAQLAGHHEYVADLLSVESDDERFAEEFPRLATLFTGVERGVYALEQLVRCRRPSRAHAEEVQLSANAVRLYQEVGAAARLAADFLTTFSSDAQLHDGAVRIGDVYAALQRSAERALGHERREFTRFWGHGSGVTKA